MKIFLNAVIFILLFNLISRAENDDRITNKIGAFTAQLKSGIVELNWKIINPGNLYKFKIENKKSGTELYNSLSDVLFANFRRKEETDSVISYYYTYMDTPQENGVYFYKVSVYDISNKIVTEEEIKVGITEVPEFKLQQNSPNPFNPSTVISYTILVPTDVKLRVYSLTGQFVDILVDGFQSAGTYSINFNTSKYSEMSSGIYFYKLETAGFKVTNRMILIK